MGTILLLAGLGFLLLLTEMFVPGGVLGVLGCLLLVAAIIVGYVELGAVWGSALGCGILSCVFVGFCVWMAIFPRTAVGKKMILGQTLSRGDAMAPSVALVGSEGVALTMLRPAGKALIHEQRMDVVSESDFIAADEAIVVVAEEGMRIVVRKKA